MSAAFHVYNLGCKVNRVESDTIIARLVEWGAEFTSSDKASVVILNSCAVTAEADAKTRKAARRFAAAEQNPWVLVTGCSAALHAEGLASLGARLIVEPNRVAALEKAILLMQNDALQVAASENDAPQVAASGNDVLRVDALYSGAQQAVAPQNATPYSNASKLKSQLKRAGENFNTRVGIKIHDGCDNRCSYCIVPTVRGFARSVAADEVLVEVKRHADAGTREFIFTGINLGAYHDDSYGLVRLLRASLEQAPEARIRLSSLEPLDVTRELLKCVADSKGRICAHLHLPLQSGSTRILKLMNRPYTSNHYEEIIQNARMVLPNLAITTDVIVGFPGETEKDFEETLALCARAAFSKIHVFRYSKRPGTPAAAMHPQVSPVDKNQRAKNLIQLSEHLAEIDAASRVGTTELVLFERAGRGTSESYHRVEIGGQSGAPYSSDTPYLSGAPYSPDTPCPSNTLYPPGALLPVRFVSHRAAILLG